MESPKGGVEPPQAPPASNPPDGSPKDVELPPSRWDSPKSPTPPRVASPEPNCAICLGALENKSFTNSCMHQFCFVCLLEWSKVKAECPLCKNTFKSIIHNVRSMEDYDQYEVLRPAPPPEIPTPNWMTWSLAQFGLYGDMQAIPSGRRPPPRSRRDRNVAGTSAFRRHIYDQDLWARMQPDVSGRYRECSPQFYRMNPAMLNRLVPFLQRELNVLMPNSPEMPAFVDAILHKLRHHRINGREFRTYIRQLVGPRHAAHFCHELHAYASSPFDLIGYDRATEYQPNNNNNQQLPDLVEVIEDSPSSSGSDTDDTDSDVQYVSRPAPVFGVITTADGETTSVELLSRLRQHVPDVPSSPQPGPSGLNHRLLSPPRRSANADQSVYIVDSSDSDECTIVDVVKPRHERTPVVVTLSSTENSPRTPPPDDDDDDSSFNLPATATEPFDSDLEMNGSQVDSFETLTDFSPVPSCSKGKVKRRPRFNSSGSSSGDSDQPPPQPQRTEHRSSASHWKKDMAQSAWSPESSPRRETERTRRERPRPRLRSVATRVSPPPRRHRDKPKKYRESDSEDSCGPSTSYSSGSRHHRDRLILQRTSSVAGEDVWTVNSASRTWQSDSDDEYSFQSPVRSGSRRKRTKSDSESGSSSGHSRHKHRDSSSKSRKKHKKKERSKSKKRRKEKESTRKERSKRCKHESDE